MQKLLVIIACLIVALAGVQAVEAKTLRIGSSGDRYLIMGEVLGDENNQDKGNSNADKSRDTSNSDPSADSGSGKRNNGSEEANHDTGRGTGGQIRIEVRNGEMLVANDEDEEEAAEELEFETDDEASSDAGLGDDEEEPDMDLGEDGSGSGSSGLTEIEVEESADNYRIKIKAREDFLEIKFRGIGALTHFPLTIGAGNELIVNTPAGARTVTVLPAAAVANILQSNIMDRILAYRAGQASASATPFASASVYPESSASAIPTVSPIASGSATGATGSAVTPAESTATEDIELVMAEGRLIYKIKGEKEVKFLGVFRMILPVSADVSAETGEVVRVYRTLLLNYFPFLFTG